MRNALWCLLAPWRLWRAWRYRRALARVDYSGAPEAPSAPEGDVNDGAVAWCDECMSWVPAAEFQRRRLNTAYVNEESNFHMGCLGCYIQHYDCYAEQWEEFYNGRGCGYVGRVARWNEGG